MSITPRVDVMLVLPGIFMGPAPLVADPMQACLPQTAPRPWTVRAVLQLEIAAAGANRQDGRMLAPTQLEHRLEEALVQGTVAPWCR